MKTAKRKFPDIALMMLLFAAISLTLSGMFSSVVVAQNAQPSASTPAFKGVIDLDVRKSTPDWAPYLPKKAPEGAPNVLFILLYPTDSSAKMGRNKNGTFFKRFANEALQPPSLALAYSSSSPDSNMMALTSRAPCRKRTMRVSHGTWLSRPLGLGLYARAHPSRLVREMPRKGRAGGKPNGGHHRQSECEER